MNNLTNLSLKLLKAKTALDQQRSYVKILKDRSGVYHKYVDFYLKKNNDQPPLEFSKVLDYVFWKTELELHLLANAKLRYHKILQITKEVDAFIETCAPEELFKLSGFEITTNLEYSNLHTMQEWCKITGVIVYDPDGWRIDNTPLDTPITIDDFDQRCVRSTCSYPKSKSPTVKDSLTTNE